MPQLDPRSTALVLIDLQKGVLGMPLAPRPAADVLEASRKFAQRFRAAQAPVVLVHVAFAADFKDAPGGPSIAYRLIHCLPAVITKSIERTARGH